MEITPIVGTMAKNVYILQTISSVSGMTVQGTYTNKAQLKKDLAQMRQEDHSDLIMEIVTAKTVKRERF